ncbi:MAG: hypothetical protein QM751_10850 [Paludibacteraceae bacterium]
MRRSLLILIISVCISFVNASPRLTRNYAFRHFTTRDGLVQMQLMCAFQDRDGYMWFGTKGGVSRWDGVTFKNYTAEDGIPFGEILSISEWGKRKLFFTHRQMVILFENDSLFVQELPEKMEVPHFGQKSLVLDKDNLALFGLVEIALEYQNNCSYHYRYNINTHRFKRIEGLKDKVTRVENNRITGHKAVYEWTNNHFREILHFPFEVENALFDKDWKNALSSGLKKMFVNYSLSETGNSKLSALN